jgi:hypothetical protein
MAISFLEDTLIAEKTIKPGIFNHYQPATGLEGLDHMILDS